VDALVARQMGVTALLRAVRAEEEEPVPAAFMTTSRDAGEDLTSREIDVLKLISTGRTTHQISGELEISPKTVENHKQRTFRKLGVQNQAHAVALALRRGILLPDAVIDLTAQGADARSVTLVRG
jgi:DNA-binding NarL/FixJ family response regulator